MPTAHKGVEHLSTLVEFIITVVGAIRKAGEDGKFSFTDAFAFWPVVKAAPGAFKEIGEVPGELADLDPVEAEELVNRVEAHFGSTIPAGRTADIVDAALGIIPQFANLYMTIVNPPPKAEPA